MRGLRLIQRVWIRRAKNGRVIRPFSPYSIRSYKNPIWITYAALLFLGNRFCQEPATDFGVHHSRALAVIARILFPVGRRIYRIVWKISLAISACFSCESQGSVFFRRVGALFFSPCFKSCSTHLSENSRRSLKMKTASLAARLLLPSVSLCLSLPMICLMAASWLALARYCWYRWSLSCLRYMFWANGMNPAVGIW